MLGASAAAAVQVSGEWCEVHAGKSVSWEVSIERESTCEAVNPGLFFHFV